VQIVSTVGGVIVEVEHIGSAHTDAELGLLLAAARERLHPGQGEVELGLLPEVAVGSEDVADWTRRSAGELPLSSTSPGPEAGERPGGRRPVVAAVAWWSAPPRCCCGTCSRPPTIGSGSVSWPMRCSRRHFDRHGDYFTDGQILESSRVMGSGKDARTRRIVYQYSFKRRKLDDRAINAMVERAEKVAAGTRPLMTCGRSSGRSEWPRPTFARGRCSIINATPSKRT
jgi:hypothetical protein